jgi:hypothetical protein
MTRFSFRFALAALALSATTVLVTPTPAALAAKQADLSVRMTADRTTVQTRDQVTIHTFLNHTAAGTSGGVVDIWVASAFSNVRLGNSTDGYRCTIGPGNFLGSRATKVSCTKSVIGNDSIVVLATAPINGDYGFFAQVRPTDGVDPDTSDNAARVDVHVKIKPGAVGL